MTEPCVVQELVFPRKRKLALRDWPNDHWWNPLKKPTGKFTRILLHGKFSVACPQSIRVTKLCLHFQCNSLERIRNHFTAFTKLLLPLQLLSWDANWADYICYHQWKQTLIPSWNDTWHWFPSFVHVQDIFLAQQCYVNVMLSKIGDIIIYEMQ